MEILQVKEFNQLAKSLEGHRLYVMTSGTGAMFEPERVKGWVIFTRKDGGSIARARLFKNIKEANNWLLGSKDV